LISRATSARHWSAASPSGCRASAATDFAEYLDYLEVHPDEFGQLFNTVLINVTSFFRDGSAWEYIASSVVPRLIDGASRGAPVRVWSAGCATGEEAYTLAMVFAEALGVEAFAERVKIYATDVDEEALAKARAASYDEHEVAEVPPPLLEKYFDVVSNQYVFQKELRRQIIFGRHDLIQDAPISRVDLLVCRNTLMYFNAETQAKILQRFQFALNDDGRVVPRPRRNADDAYEHVRATRSQAPDLDQDPHAWSHDSRSLAHARSTE
jgi:two-component system CheB/CheR fusion protein